jgi:hypothetical protein
MKVFHTESGSVYQLDEANQKIRRLSGVNAPTPRQGQDGEWRPYAEVMFIPNGSCLIHWYYDDDPVEGKIGRCTMTSKVTKMEDVQ